MSATYSDFQSWLAPQPSFHQAGLPGANIPDYFPAEPERTPHAPPTRSARVLIVEPDPLVRNALVTDFQREGFQTEIAETAHRTLMLLRQTPMDAVILGLSLPDRPGLEVCRELRAAKVTRDVPILMVTSHPHEAEHVLVLESGADDYVAKPFSTRQMILRTKAVLRRSGVLSTFGERLESGPLTIDCSAHRVFLSGDEVPLTSTEYRLLLLLLRHPGRVFSRNELLDHVWNMPNRVVTRTVDTHVKRLRQKLRRAGVAIETVRNAGYRYGSATWDNPGAPS